MLNECPRITPVSESISIMERVATGHGDEREEKQPNHQHHFEYGQVKLGDAEVSDGSHVENGVQDNHDHDDGRHRHLVGPEGKHDVHGHNLKGHEEGHIEEEIPGHSESQRVVHPFASETDKGRRHGQVGHHLSEAFVHRPHDGAPKQEGDEEAGRTSLGKGGTHLHKEGYRGSLSAHCYTKRAFMVSRS